MPASTVVGFGPGGHDRLLVVDGLVQPVDLAGGARQERLETGPMRRQQLPELGRIGLEDGADGRQADVELTQSSDQPRVVELVATVGAIPGVPVDARGLHQSCSW